MGLHCPSSPAPMSVSLMCSSASSMKRVASKKRQRSHACDEQRSFEQLEEMVPDLVAEMRDDIESSPFSRGLIVFRRKWSCGGQENSFFTYFREEHDELLGKLNVMANYGALADIRFNDVYRYEMTMEFVEYLQLPG